MRRILLCSLSVFGLGILIGCGGGGGGGGSNPSPTPQVTSFAFLQDTSGDRGGLTPMLGTFTVTGSNVQFTSSPAAIDASTGKPVSGAFSSIILSPDGKKATVDMYGGTIDSPSTQWDIWVATVSGITVNLVQVTNDSYADRMPQFSPDGTKVVFVSDNQPGISIAIKNADGTGNEQLLPIPPGVEMQLFPTFSPDSSKIAMEAWGYNTSTNTWFDGIWIMNSDGSNAKMLTNALTQTCDCSDEMPVFSSDGSKIFFSRFGMPNSTADHEDVYVMNADGSGVAKLTDSVGVNFDPLLLNVAGLGQRILFSSNRSNSSDATDKSYELYSMNTDGTAISRLTSNSLFDAFCDWWYWQGGSGASAQRVRAQSRVLQGPGHLPSPRPDWR